MPIAIMPTSSGVTLSLPGKSHPVVVSKASENYDKVVEVLRKGTGDEQAAEILEILEGPARRLAEALADSQLTETLSIKDGVVLYKGKAVHNYVSSKLLELVRAGFPATSLVNFMERLMKNPIPKVINRLYQFLEKGGIPLTEDGYFEAYKVVRDTYFDKHSNTMDNSVGKVVEMERWEVNDNDEQTCSNGLHVCSYSYIQAFSGSGDRLVVCKVDPADVVSIPVDYNDAKMRCCKYEVVREIEEFYVKREPVGDVLSRSPLSVDNSDDTFQIVDEFGSILAAFEYLSEAAQSFEDAESEFDFDCTTEIRLVNTQTNVVIERKTIFVESDDENDNDFFDDDENTESESEREYSFYVKTSDGSFTEGMDSLLGALELSKELAGNGYSGSIQNAAGATLRSF